MLYRVENVQVAFARREVLRGVTFQHNPGEKLVLLGRNGCGKTTLLRVITGEQEPDVGLVERARGLEVARVEQRLLVDPATPVLAVLPRGLRPLLEVEAEIARLQTQTGEAAAAAAAAPRSARAARRLPGHALAPRRHCRGWVSASPCTGGRSARFPAASAPGSRWRGRCCPRLPLLLLDEPTNHLDLVGVEYLAAELGQRAGALLLVTHDRDLIDRVGGEILELHGGRIEGYPAGYARYRREREARRDQQRKAYELQHAEIERQEDFIRRNMAGQNTRQAQSRQKLLDRLDRLEPPRRTCRPCACGGLPWAGPVTASWTSRG